MHPFKMAHIKKSCTDKKAYMTSGLAAVAAHELMYIEPGITLMGAYRCDYCADWHLTKKMSEAGPDFLVIYPEKILPRNLINARNKKKRWLKRREKDNLYRDLLDQRSDNGREI